MRVQKWLTHEKGGKKVRWRREEHSLQNFYHSSALRVHRELIKIPTELSLGVEPTRSAHSLRIDIYIHETTQWVANRDVATLKKILHSNRISCMCVDRCILKVEIYSHGDVSTAERF